MPRAYSIDLRERVVAACDAGGRPEEVGPRFSVEPRTVYYWLQLRKTANSLAPKPASGGSVPKLAPYAEKLRELVRKQPDATLEELRSRLSIPVCIGTVRNMLLRLKLSFKKEGHSRRRAGA